MKSKIKRILLALFILSLLIICTVGIVSVNRRYPPAEEERIPVGDAVLFQGASFTVTRAEWVEIGSLPKDDPMRVAVGEEFGYPAKESRALVITFMLANGGSTPIDVDLSTVNVESGNSSAPISQVSAIFGSGIVYHHLEAGESKEIIILQTFYRDHYTSREWKTLKDRQFYFVTSLYPTKQMVLIPKGE